MAPQRLCWYFADPMCSWCWGFSPVAQAIRERCGDEARVALVLGGLRPGARKPMTSAQREEILHHWHEVHRRTGQPFAFEGALPGDFVYDTEPPSRAVIAAGELDSASTFLYFQSVQRAFYVEREDVTQPETLAVLAGRHGLDPVRFRERFEADDVKRATQTHFRTAREAGIHGFPTVVLQDESGYRLLTHGYRSWSELGPELEAWLAHR